jgi:pterin-4a-carbinolamine dehydratase
VSATSATTRHPAAAGWRLVGQRLVRELSFRDFEQALACVERVATAEDYLRRPDMCILDFNRVRLQIANPNHAGVTEAELRLADKVNAVIDGL